MASLMVQTVRNLPAVQETWVQSLGWENPMEKRIATGNLLYNTRNSTWCSVTT